MVATVFSTQQPAFRRDRVDVDFSQTTITLDDTYFTMDRS